MKKSTPLSTNTTCQPEHDSGSNLKQSLNLAPNVLRQVRNHVRAFTLIELLVVIVIIGILATVSVAQFNEYQEKARMARSQTFASQVDHVLMAETSSTGYGFPLRLDFEEGSGTVAKDSSGSGNDTVDWSGKNITWINDTPDSSSFSLNLNNTQAFVYNVKNMPQNEVSFSAFIKMNAFPSSANSTYPLFISGNSGIAINPNGLTQFYINSGGSSNAVMTNTDYIKLDRWYHFLGTYKNNLLRFYVDGKLIGEKNIPLTLPFTQNATAGEMLNLYIGYGVLGQEFNGSIDRVRIYPVGLDPSNL